MHWFAVFAFATLAALGVAPAAAPDANTLLFETPHLAAVAPGTTLSYRVARNAAEGEFPPVFADRIELAVSEGAGEGRRNAAVLVVNGERRREPAPFTDITGNPITIIFLEQDVLDMGRLLRGNPTYFRKRVRIALEEAATIAPARFEFAGRPVEGWTISATPFAADANRGRLLAFADKRYEITLAEAVPGGVYSIRTVTPKPGGNGVLVEDSLTFSAASESRR